MTTLSTRKYDFSYFELDRKYDMADYATMIVRDIVQTRPAVKIDIPFTPEEAALFRTFLKSTGRKRGPWIRTLVLAALKSEGCPGENAAIAVGENDEDGR
jgi:hypothetical protein